MGGCTLQNTLSRHLLLVSQPNMGVFRNQLSVYMGSFAKIVNSCEWLTILDVLRCSEYASDWLSYLLELRMLYKLSRIKGTFWYIYIYMAAHKSKVYLELSGCLRWRSFVRIVFYWNLVIVLQRGSISVCSGWVLNMTLLNLLKID